MLGEKGGVNIEICVNRGPRPRPHEKTTKVLVSWIIMGRVVLRLVIFQTKTDVAWGGMARVLHPSDLR